jgi:tetratricopeptide (TPR) repeat protein
MPGFSRRFIYALTNKIFQRSREKNEENNLVLDFAKIKTSPFDIKSENSYNSYLSKAPEDGSGSLVLGLKKSNCIAWVEIPELEYQDHVIEAKIRLDSMGGYASTGVIFRLSDRQSYYLALVSSKGYFRLDVVKDNSPKTLIAWTDFSDFDGTNIRLEIITYGTTLIFIVNNKWMGEATDDTITEGRLGFVLASYEPAAEGSPPPDIEEEDEGTTPAGGEYTCKAFLDYFSVDERYKTVEEKYIKWTDDANINAESRLRIAETFAVMGEYVKALDQITRAWKRRSDAIRAVSTAADPDVKTKRELLLAARMAFRLERYDEAEEYINAILDEWSATPEGKSARAEKIKVLNELNKFPELKEFALKHYDAIEKDIDFYTLLGRCHWELNEYEPSAQAWKEAFNLDGENGVYAANAANALELAGNKKEALDFYITAGKLFLNQDNQAELAAIMPKLASLGGKNWEARVLAGKWAFSLEDYDNCEAEFAAANKIRASLKPRPKGDPAHYYLWGLVMSLKGKNNDAIKLVDRAVRLAPDYGLFRFKLAELKVTGGVKDPNLAAELKTALKTFGGDPDGKMAAYAANILLKAGDKKNARYFLDRVKK